MSHMTKCKTLVKDKSCLIQALEDLGFKGKLEIYEEAIGLYGYMGDMREQTAEIVIRRQNIGASSNDVGFKLQADGTWEAIISGFDTNRFSKNWLKKLYQRYSYHRVKEQLSSQGYDLVSEEEENGEIHLQAVCSILG